MDVAVVAARTPIAAGPTGSVSPVRALRPIGSVGATFATTTGTIPGSGSFAGTAGTITATWTVASSRQFAGTAGECDGSFATAGSIPAGSIAWSGDVTGATWKGDGTFATTWAITARSITRSGDIARKAGKGYRSFATAGSIPAGTIARSGDVTGATRTGDGTLATIWSSRRKSRGSVRPLDPKEVIEVARAWPTAGTRPETNIGPSTARTPAARANIPWTDAAWTNAAWPGTTRPRCWTVALTNPTRKSSRAGAITSWTIGQIGTVDSAGTSCAARHIGARRHLADATWTLRHLAGTARALREIGR